MPEPNAVVIQMHHSPVVKSRVGLRLSNSSASRALRRDHNSSGWRANSRLMTAHCSDVGTRGGCDPASPTADRPGSAHSQHPCRNVQCPAAPLPRSVVCSAARRPKACSRLVTKRASRSWLQPSDTAVASHMHACTVRPLRGWLSYLLSRQISMANTRPVGDQALVWTWHVQRRPALASAGAATHQHPARLQRLHGQ